MFKIYAMECKWCKRLFASFPLLATKADVRKLEHDVMVKLSELAGKLTEANVKLDKIAMDVKALKDAQPPGTDPDIPALAETALTDQGTKIKAIEDILNPPPPQP